MNALCLMKVKYYGPFEHQLLCIIFGKQFWIIRRTIPMGRPNTHGYTPFMQTPHAPPYLQAHSKYKKIDESGSMVLL